MAFTLVDVLLFLVFLMRIVTSILFLIFFVINKLRIVCIKLLRLTSTAIKNWWLLLEIVCSTFYDCFQSLFNWEYCLLFIEYKLESLSFSSLVISTSSFLSSFSDGDLFFTFLAINSLTASGIKVKRVQ